MPDWYANLILAWERKLNRVDQNRRIRAFDWGSDWLQQLPVNGIPAWAATAPPEEVIEGLRAWNERVIGASPEFFAYSPVKAYTLGRGEGDGKGVELRFRSPVETPYPENQTVYARWFPARQARGAVIVIAQWNADAGGHIGLCRLLSRAGISCLRVSMPYHDRRMPSHLKRAEFTVDANIGRTIHAARQAVCDIRACLDWLEIQRYRSLGIVGTSLGSCYALLASAHDARLRVNVFNHISHYFGDVVWTGLATAHVQQSIAPHLTQPQLREAWRTISPASYLEQFCRLNRTAPKRNLLIWARYDPCFLPEFSRQVLDSFEQLHLHHEACGLPCGHYTIGRAPFKFADAYLMIRFLRRHLDGASL